ncbi:MAG: single-stranded DNA-binding protein, partial [Calditrichaeota bacterium]|nr:single-stranded DNA-binding protein [Calditrichota bacterium]
MSRGVNKVILIGNLGRDPEISYLPSGMAVAKFSLATSDSRRKGDNEWEEITEWHRITLFGKQAETAGQYLSKGSQAYIEGRIRYGSYERDGIKHNTVDIIGN